MDDPGASTSGYVRPRSLHLRSEGSFDDESPSRSGSRIRAPKSILKVRRSSSGERIESVVDSPASPQFDLGASVRRLHSLPTRTPRPRVYRVPRLTTTLSEEGDGLPRFPRVSSSRIPKLSVSWWETNSVAGEAPLMESCSDDDVSSVCSQGSGVSGMSNISQNWKGRSTRYVPHCAKRHMHRNDAPEDYLTPTQRKNRLIADLRKELRGLQKMLAEKDRHIGQLRDRLTELEGVLDQGGYLSENHRLLAKIGQLQEQNRKEKEQLIEGYETRIRKLKKNVLSDPETDMTSEGFQASQDSGMIPPPPAPAPSSVSDGAYPVPADPVESPRAHLTPRQEYLLGTDASSDSGTDVPVPVQKVSVGTLTEPDTTVQFMENQLVTAYGEIRRLQDESGLLQDRVNDLELSDARIHELEESMTHHTVTMSHVTETMTSSAREPMRSSHGDAREAELIAQVEAYKAECIVWRTRASEHELTTRDSKERYEAQLDELSQQLAEFERIKSEHDLQLATGSEDDCPNPLCVGRSERLDELEEMFDEIQQKTSRSEGVSPMPQSATDSFERSPRSPGSLSRKRRVTEALGLQNLAQELELQMKLLEAEKEQLTEKLSETENTLGVKSEELTTSVAEIVHLKKELHNRQTALEVAEITMERMRDDVLRSQEQNKSLQASLRKMEEAGTAVLDEESGVAVTPTQKKRRSRYTIVQTVSRQLQTSLTGADIEREVGEAGDLKARFGDLREKYELETADYNIRISQISENLALKNGLSETLTLQLQDLQQAYEEARARWAEERECLNDRIAELTPVAQRVPTLEKQLQDSNQEIDQLISDHRSKMEEMNAALEHSLAGAMSANKESEVYWKDKIENLESELGNCKKNAAQAHKDLKDVTLKLNLEKSQLEAIIGEKSNEISGLHAELYKPKVHVYVQSMNLGIDKSILVQIEALNVETQIHEGDLYDEKSESIKVLQGELATSRRQLEILDEKLADFTRVASSEKNEKVSALMKLVTNHQSELESLKLDKISDIGEKSSLEQKLENLVKERDNLKKKGKENLERLEQEFQLVQKELQSVVRRYENEKQRLLRKLRDARNDNDMLKWKLKVLKQEVIVLSDSYTGDGKAKLAKLQELFDDDAVERADSFEEIVPMVTLHDEGLANAALANSAVASMVDSGISDRLADSPAKTAAAALARTAARVQSITESNLTLDSDGTLEEPAPDYRIEAKIAGLADQVVSENTTLRDDLEGLREKVDIMLRDTKASQDARRAEDPDTPAPASESSDIREGVQIELQLEALKSDLMTALDDHGKITAAASNVVQTAQASLAADSKFAKLEKWLQSDIQQEKLELEAVCQWYEKDKYKLGDALRNAKREILALSKERDSLSEILRDMQGQLATLNELYREVSREMYIMKLEDVQNAELRKDEVSKSESDVHSRSKEEEEKWKSKVGKIYKEKVLLEKKFRAAKYEKCEADQNLVMLRGELEVVKASYETERDKLLAKIEELTGEVWTEEASTNYVRELQQNLEIKKQELFDFSTRYDRDVRRLQEELYAERAKRIPDAVESKIERLRAQLAPERAQLAPDARDSESNVSDVSHGSKILLKRELEKERTELILLKNELKGEQGKFENMVNDLHGKMKISTSILTEKENLVKIMEGELKSLQTALDEQAGKYNQDTARLRDQVEKLTNEKSLLKDQARVPENSPVSVSELEKTWKQELKETHERYDADVRSIRRDMIALNDRFENCRKDATQKLRACSNILMEKENNIKILERELRSAEDGLADHKQKYFKMESEYSSTINQLKILMAHNNISAPPTPTRSLTPDPSALSRPFDGSRKEVHFDVPPSTTEVSSLVRGELENYRASYDLLRHRNSYENIRQFDLDEWTTPAPELERVHESPKKEPPSITVEYVSENESHPDGRGSNPPSDSGSVAVEAPGDDVPPEHACTHCGSTEGHSTDSDGQCSLMTSEASEIAHHALSSYDDRSSGSAPTDSAHTAHEASPPLDPDPGDTPRVHSIDPEMRIVRLTKELNMVNNELEVTREKFYEDKRRWIAENAELKERLAELEKCQKEEDGQKVAAKSDLETKLSSLETELSSAKAVADERDTEFEEKLTDLKTSRREIEELREKLSEAETSRTELATLHEESVENEKANLALAESSRAELDALRAVVGKNENAKLELNSELDGLRKEMEERELQHQQMYMTMFQKGQEVAYAETQDRGSSDEYHTAHPPDEWDVKDMEAHVSSRWEQAETHARAAGKSASGSALSKEEVVLRFLRDAVYYFMINRDPKDHLFAIMNILKFSEKQRTEVLKTKGI